MCYHAVIGYIGAEKAVDFRIGKNTCPDRKTEGAADENNHPSCFDRAGSLSSIWLC
jgi:hypothetical protein